MELLPQLLFYDQVNWINLDPSRTCTFRTYEGVFVELMNPNLTATYQSFKEQASTAKCVLSTDAAKPYKNGTWMYSNHIL